MASKITPRVERRATYSALTGLFLAIFTGFTMSKSRKGNDVVIKPFDLIQLALATFRLGRLVSYDQVFETYRAPFTRTVQDPSGMGMTVEAKGKGARAAIGDLLCCPICSGTWIAAGLVYGLNLFPRATRTVLAIFSAVGAAELLNAATEALQWTGQLARERAGTERAAKLKADGTRMQDELTDTHAFRVIR
ncbi:MAG: DUF1360 domain-containing protein [Chloroflexi bacterium]|nr:DUF1360 domain-containing protein [Chloroflexota bacterium]